MATTTQHNAARGDDNLIARAVGRAEQLGVENAQFVVLENMGRIVAQPIAGGTATIADVHASAVVRRQEKLDALPPLPGADESAVLDLQLEEALRGAGLVPAPNEEAP